MSNICDYMQWRGDLTFKQSEYNEIDSGCIRWEVIGWQNAVVN